jgi:hypothetical protein
MQVIQTERANVSRQPMMFLNQIVVKGIKAIMGLVSFTLGHKVPEQVKVECPLALDFPKSLRGFSECFGIVFGFAFFGAHNFLQNV